MARKKEQKFKLLAIIALVAVILAVIFINPVEIAAITPSSWQYDWLPATGVFTLTQAYASWNCPESANFRDRHESPVSMWIKGEYQNDVTCEVVSFGSGDFDHATCSCDNPGVSGSGYSEFQCTIFFEDPTPGAQVTACDARDAGYNWFDVVAYVSIRVDATYIGECSWCGGTITPGYCNDACTPEHSTYCGEHRTTPDGREYQYECFWSGACVNNPASGKFWLYLGDCKLGCCGDKCCENVYSGAVHVTLGSVDIELN